MKAEELIANFNRIYGHHQRPQTYEVDSDTYANCCQTIFDDYVVKLNEYVESGGDASGLKSGNITVISTMIGPNGGLMFKGVELILQGYQRK